MEISYWISRWEKNKTGWHQRQVNPKLREYWKSLDISPNPTVLVPLCGKSIDLQWLSEQAQKVIGIEVSEKAVREFLEQHAGDYTTQYRGEFVVYQSDAFEIWQGNYFHMKWSYLEPIDAVYDRAALVSMPPAKRTAYAKKLLELTASRAEMLLISFDYSQQEMNGPPFSVPVEEIQQHYGPHYEIEVLHKENLIESVQKFNRRGLKSYFFEKVYRLKPYEN